MRREADLAGLPCAGVAVAAARGVRGEIDVASGGGGLAEEQGRARGRVDLLVVMHLDDLDVPVGRAPAPPGATRLARRLTPSEKLPDLTIRAPAFAAAAIAASSSALQPVVPMMWISPRFAASFASATLAAGAVKSTIASARRERGLGIVADGDAQRFDAGEDAGVLADRRGAFAVEGGDDLDLGRPMRTREGSPRPCARLHLRLQP